MPSPHTSRRPNLLRSLRRRVLCAQATPADIAEGLRRGEVERLLGEGTLLQSKPRCEVVRVDHPIGPMLLKRHTWGDTARTLRMAFRAPVARKCYQHGHWLLERGIPTPRPLALVEDRLGPLGLRSYLLTEFIEGESLFDLLRWGNPSAEQCQHLARQVADIWQRLIDISTVHGDLKPENFIVDWTGRVWLIDLEKLRPGVSGSRLVAQHLIDAASFLHVRTWRNSLAAAETFRQALLATQLKTWADESASPSHPLNRHGYTLAELALRVATLVVADQHAPPSAIEATRKSARVLSDEIVVVNSASSRIPRVDAPWLLMLRAGERISPDLARHLIERLEANPRAAAVKIPLLDATAEGRRQPAKDAFSESRIRALHNTRCPAHLVWGKLVLAVSPEAVVGLNDAIEVVSPVGAATPLPLAA